MALEDVSVSIEDEGNGVVATCSGYDENEAIDTATVHDEANEAGLNVERTVSYFESGVVDVHVSDPSNPAEQEAEP